MPVTPEELVRVLAMLAEEEKLRVTVMETLKGGAMAGSGAVIGGLVAGPIGLAVGAIIGGLTASRYVPPKTLSVREIIEDMDVRGRERLHASFDTVLSTLDGDDAKSLKLLMDNDPAVKAKVVECLESYINSKLWKGFMIPCRSF